MNLKVIDFGTCKLIPQNSNKGFYEKYVQLRKKKKQNEKRAFQEAGENTAV